MNKKHQSKPSAKLEVLTQAEQQAMTPQEALERLKAGNKRFVEKAIAPAEHARMVTFSEDGQYPCPIATVLSCIDSRVPPEIVFNQAIGNIFVSRVPASVISPDVLGGIEFSTHVAGTKVIVVLGHENCRAVEAACENVSLSHITGILDKIQPAIVQTQSAMPNGVCNHEAYVDQVAKQNILNIVKEIPQQSALLKQNLDDGKIMIVGAMYHLNSGEVEFLT